MLEILSRAATAVANFFGTAAAKYHLYLDDANAKARAEAQANSIATLWEQYGSAYNSYLQCLIDCITNVYSRLGLNRPGPLPQHMAPYDAAIFIDSNRGLVFRYTFDRGIDVTGGGMMKHIQNNTVPLTTNPPEQMAHQLNQVLPNYCLCSSLVPICIDRAYDIDGSRVCFECVSRNGGIPL